MDAASRKLRLAKVETPKQASERFDAVQKKLRDDYYLRHPEHEVDWKPRSKS